VSFGACAANSALGAARARDAASKRRFRAEKAALGGGWRAGGWVSNAGNLLARAGGKE